LALLILTGLGGANVPFGTKIQTYNGPHAVHGGAENCGVDWKTNRLWMADNVNISRYNILSGVEQASVLAATVPNGGGSVIGWDGVGHVYYLTAPALNHGGIATLDDMTLAYIDQVNYAPPFFGDVNIVKSGNTKTMAATNVGNTIIGSLNNTSYSNDPTYLGSIGWPNSNARSCICSGADTTSYSFLCTSPGNGLNPQIVTLQRIDSLGNPTVIRTYIPHDIDGAWTESYWPTMCVDQKDNNPIFCVFGVGSAVNNYMIKVDNGNGAIIWKTPLTTTGPEQIGGNQFSQTRIRDNVLAFLQRTPFVQIVVMNTATGAITSTQSTGLAGISNNINAQSYDDTSGAIIGQFTWDGTGPPTGPASLNGSSGPFTGWAALYVTPPTGGRGGGGGSGMGGGVGGGMGGGPNTRPIRSTASFNQQLTQANPFAGPVEQAMSFAEAERWCV
jgi:hypothetical protein